MYRMTGNEQCVSYTPIPKPIQMRRRLPDRVEVILMDICGRYGVSDIDVMGKSRLRPIVRARREFLRTLHFKIGYSFSRIAYLTHLDLTSVLHHLGMRKSSKIKYEDLKKFYQ